MTTCPTCGARVVIISGDEGTSHYEPTEGHLAREWEQRWEQENRRAQAAEKKLEAVRDATMEIVRAVQGGIDAETEWRTKHPSMPNERVGVTLDYDLANAALNNLPQELKGEQT